MKLFIILIALLTSFSIQASPRVFFKTNKVQKSCLPANGLLPGIGNSVNFGLSTIDCSGFTCAPNYLPSGSICSFAAVNVSCDANFCFLNNTSSFANLYIVNPFGSGATPGSCGDTNGNSSLNFVAVRKYYCPTYPSAFITSKNWLAVGDNSITNDWWMVYAPPIGNCSLSNRVDVYPSQVGSNQSGGWYNFEGNGCTRIQ